MPKAVYRFEVADSRGRLIAARPVTLSDFGTFHETLALDSAAPVGTYRIRVFQPGKSDFSGSFEVHSYQLEPIALAFDLKKTVFYRGETIQATLVAKYQYGAPVAGRPVEVQLPDGRILHGTTDAAGQFPVEFPTEGFAEEQSLDLAARLPQDNVATAASVMLAIQGFRIGLNTTRDIYLDGESFQLQVDTADAQGKPVGQSLSAAIVKLIESGGRITEREMQRKQLTTDAKTGPRLARVPRSTIQDGGRYVVRVAGTDRFGNPIVADRPLAISGKKDETKLRLLADRQRYKVGEEASVNLHSRDRAGTALLTWEADRILTYKIVRLNEGNNPVAWVVDGAQFPNFTLTATRMAKNELDQARLDVQVERDLKVEISVAKAVGRPGRPGRNRRHDRRSARPAGSPPSFRSRWSISRCLRLFNDSLPAIGAVLLRPDPNRGLRHRGDQHVSVCARHDGRCLGPGGRTRAAGRSVCRRRRSQGRRRQTSAKQTRNATRWHRRGRLRPRLAPIAPPAPAARTRPRVQLARPACESQLGQARAWRWTECRAADGAIDRRLGKRADEAGKEVASEQVTVECRRARSARRMELRRVKRSTTRVAMARSAATLTSTGASERAAARERFVETAYWNPRRRHRQGRQGPCELQGALGPFGIPHHGARRHRRRHAGRPDDRDA